MCGIAGVINYESINLENLMRSLQHRGPDDKNIYKESHIALIHTRLAIQDIQNGSQPFHYQNFSIIFNGEIYNHQALRLYLREFTFKTNSDTETLLYLFIKYQYKMFDMLDGMYVFCIYDRKKQEIVLARDRAGKKPLYYFQDNKMFIFASELNAIKSVKKLDILPDAVNCYLRTGMIWKPFTAYRNVFELESASYLILDIHTLQSKINTYFSIVERYKKKSDTKLNFQEILNKLDLNLKKKCVR